MILRSMLNIFRILYRINECEAQIRHKLKILEDLKTENQILKNSNTHLDNEIQEINL